MEINLRKIIGGSLILGMCVFGTAAEARGGHHGGGHHSGHHGGHHHAGHHGGHHGHGNVGHRGYHRGYHGGYHRGGYGWGGAGVVGVPVGGAYACPWVKKCNTAGRCWNQRVCY